MDKHENILEKLCRLCGITVKVNDKYTVIKKVNQCTHKIKALFKYDVKGDKVITYGYIPREFVVHVEGK